MATLIAPANIVPSEDAEALHSASKGWGTNEKAVTAILGHRNAAQRKQIKQAYTDLYQDDLVKRLESELKGDFEKVVYRWLLDPEDRDAVLANVALKKSGNYHVIAEIACIYSSEELLAVRRAYHARYKLSLEEDVAAHTSGDVRKLLVGLVTAFRYEGHEINAKLAKSEADILHDAIKGKAFSHEEVLRILTTRSKAQLMATFNRYRDDHGISLEVQSEVSIVTVFWFTKLPDVVPSPTQDAKSLRNAVQGLGTSEQEIIWILGHRNASQRKKIKDTYQQLYNESLVDRLHSELSGDFRTAVVLWTYDPPERDARLANEVLKGRKKGIKQLQVIVEIACASSPYHLQAVRQAYCALFDCSLEEHITSDVPLPLRKILVGLVSSFRYDKELVDTIVANNEAAKLHEAIKKKQLDHDDMVYILSTRNVHHLRETFESYKQNYGNPIDQDIKNCGHSDLESLLRVAICCIDRPETHFAKVIGTAIIGLGTDEDSLTRAIVTRAEIDLMKVRGEYFNVY